MGFTQAGATGYDAGPTPDGRGAEGYWWFPSLGYSMQLGVSVFEDRFQAKEAALKAIDDRMAKLAQARERVIHDRGDS